MSPNPSRLYYYNKLTEQKLLMRSRAAAAESVGRDLEELLGVLRHAALAG